MKRKLSSIIIFLTFSILGGTMGATLVAKSLNFHQSLGRSLFTYSYPIYPFWKFFFWQNFVPKEILSIGITYFLVGTVLGLIIAISINFAFTLAPIIDSKKVFGDASWATTKDIKNLKLLDDKGIFLGKLKDGRYIRHDGPEHYAVIAPTRTGKGAGIVVPTLCTWKGSTIVYDLKEENFRITAKERSKFSEIIYFNPSSLESAHFNPLFEIRKGIHEVKDAQNIANMIIEPDKPGQSDHWTRTGNSLLTASILHVLYSGNNQEKNLAGVTNLLSRPEMSLTETLNEMLETKHIKDENGMPSHPHPGVVSAVRDVLNKSPDDKSSVVSTIMGYLAVYRDPLLANCTKDSDFSIEELISSESPKSLYFIIPPADIDRLRPVIRLIVNLICRRLTEPTDIESMRRRHKLLLMLDEFPALGRLEFFESALAFIAGYGLKALLVCQSMNQLKQVYGERTSILDNTHVRVFYTPNTIETADYISRTLGDSTVEYKTQGESGQKGTPFYTNKNESLHISKRSLLTPREVMELPSDEALVFVGGARPIRCFKNAYYIDSNFTSIVDNPPNIKRNSNLVCKNEWLKESKKLSVQHKKEERSFFDESRLVNSLEKPQKINNLTVKEIENEKISGSTIV